LIVDLNKLFNQLRKTRIKIVKKFD
jgi:hypothetical protein